MQVLIVDDEMITLRGIEQSVDWIRCGFTKQPFLALDVSSAITILEENEIDVILCDIEMPGESGLDLLEYVQERNMDLVFIILTCHADFKYAQNAMHLGCQEYLLKPVMGNEVEAVIQSKLKLLLETRKEREVIKYGENWIKNKINRIEQMQGQKMTSEEMAELTKAYILDHLDQKDMNVSMLAGRLFIHEDYLNRLFNRHLGISVKKYMIHERMKLAVRLLCDTELSISRIAEQSGYENEAYFSSAFKKIFGCSPSDYRQNNNR